LNRAQLDARQRALDAQAPILAKRIKATNAKSFDGLDPKMLHDFERWKAEEKVLKNARQQLEGHEAIMAKNGPMGNSRGYEPESTTTTNKMVSRAANPLALSELQMRGMFEAVRNRLPSYRIEVDGTAAFAGNVGTKAAFGESDFTSGAFPNILTPQNTLDLPYEPDRLLDHFIQQGAPVGPGVSYLRHTGNTNPAAVVPELSQKPDLGMILEVDTVNWVTIACLASFSIQSVRDFPTFQSLVPQEIYRAIIDAETETFVNSTTDPVGILSTPGVLTREVGSDTNIDAIRKAMNDIRVGSAFGQANLIALHPTSWDTIRLSKSTGGLYLLNPQDPSAIGDMDNIFGAKVIVNTKIPLGTAIVMDTSKAILRWVRDGFSLDINSFGADQNTNYWSQNAVGFRGELRENIGIQYPAAINILTGLPTS
jgi:hypothetical protein